MPKPKSRSKPTPKPEFDKTTSFVFHGACHMTSPTWTWLSADGKRLMVECDTCKKVIVELDVVAPTPKCMSANCQGH